MDVDADAGDVRLRFRSMTDGKHHDITLAGDACVLELKCLLYSLTDIDPSAQQLMLGYPPVRIERQDDDTSLADAGIISGQTITFEVATSSSDAAAAAAEPTEQKQQDSAVAAMLPPMTATPLDADTLARTRTLLFGTDAVDLDVERWHTQGFAFSTCADSLFGLTQTYGGPCGILAPVQCQVIAHLFDDQAAASAAAVAAGSEAIVVDDRVPLAPTPAAAHTALLHALARILLQVRSMPSNGGRGEISTTPASSSQSSSSDMADDDATPPLPPLSLVVGTRDEPCLITLELPASSSSSSFSSSSSSSSSSLSSSPDDADVALVVAALRAHAEPTLASPVGVLYFVYSCLLTRGHARVRSDMDDAGADVGMVARFGHCSQELVNLMVCGCAVTNVFDGCKVLGDQNDPTAFVLKGVPQPSDVGFLTLLEAMKYGKVGHHLKQPRRPIWVVGSSSHYTCLFATDARVNTASAAEQQRQRRRAAFTVLDPEENGFIPTAQLPQLFSALNQTASSAADTFANVQVDAVHAAKIVDADDTGIVLWAAFDNFMETRAREAAAAAAPVVPTIPRTEPWSCAACTFRNEAAATACEMCATPVPPLVSPEARAAAAAAEAALKADACPSTFFLYHFNGLTGHGGVTAPTFSRVHVTLMDDDLRQQLAQGQSDKRGLREVVQTRWPGCLVEYESGDAGTVPKIT